MFTLKDQGFGDLNEFDGQRIEVLRDVTDEDRANGTVEPYDDLVKLIRLPDGAVIGARADEVIEHRGRLRRLLDRFHINEYQED